MKSKAIPGFEGRYTITKTGIVFSRRSNRALVSSLNKSSGYMTVNLCKNGTQRLYRIGQLVLLAFRGPRPPGLVGDHKNVNKTDDRLENLRYVSHSVNMHNFRRNGKHGFRGVALHRGGLKKPWKAQIQHDKNHFCLGYFLTAQEAAVAYDKKAVEIFGPTAMTNKALGIL